MSVGAKVPDRGSFESQLLEEYDRRQRNLKAREWRAIFNMFREVIFVLHRVVYPPGDANKEQLMKIDNRLYSTFYDWNRELEAEIHQDTYREDFKRFIEEEKRSLAREEEKKKFEQEAIRRKVELMSEGD